MVEIHTAPAASTPSATAAPASAADLRAEMLAALHEAEAFIEPVYRHLGQHAFPGSTLDRVRTAIARAEAC